MYFSCGSAAVETVWGDYFYQRKLSLSLVERLHSGPSVVPASSAVFSPLFTASCYKRCRLRPGTGLGVGWGGVQSRQLDEGVEEEEAPGRSVLFALGDITVGK